MATRTNLVFDEEVIARIADTVHSWRQDLERQSLAPYIDTPGYCRSATKAEIAEHGYVLTAGRYVGAEDVEDIEDDDEAFNDKMTRLDDIPALYDVTLLRWSSNLITLVGFERVHDEKGLMLLDCPQTWQLQPVSGSPERPVKCRSRPWLS